MADKEPVTLLEELIEEAKALAFEDESGRDRLMRRSEMILRRVRADRRYLESLADIRFDPSISPVGDDYARSVWDEAKAKVVNLFSTVIEELQMFGDDRAVSSGAAIAGPKTPRTGRKVFVVHGHDESLKEKAARLLQRLELEPIILHEQPNRGRTIIEKFEDYSDVSFAVVLLTPDDMGYEAGEDPSVARPRPRQNVILELGFFLGLLGREHVAAVHTGDDSFEKPSDYDGVVFIPVDPSGRWQFDLVRELKACGIEVDANRVV